MMLSLRGLAFAACVAAAPPALAQQQTPDIDTVTIEAPRPSGRPTLMSQIAQNELPTTTEGLIARLNEPGVCGKADRPVPDKNWACAIVVYYLVDREPTASTPILVFRAIQHITHPDDPLDTAMRMIDIDGKIMRFSEERLDEPLRPMRVENSCKRVWGVAKDLGKIKRCQNVNARYIPIGILGFGENERLAILTGKTKESLFSLNVDIGEDARRNFR